MSGQRTTTRQADATIVGAATERLPLLWETGGLADSADAAGLSGKSFDPHFRESWSEIQISGLLSNAAAWLELGRSDMSLVAFALSRLAVDEVELLLCAVDPDWRRQGIGQQLLERVVDGARKRGARRLFLEVRASNEPALSLYRAFGFHADGRRPGYYRTSSGGSIDAITLSLAF